MLEKIDFSFGIITSQNSSNNLNIIIDSFEEKNTNYKIIIVGSIENKFGEDVKIVEFDEL